MAGPYRAGRLAAGVKLTILTKIPSPYQVELYDAIAASPGVDLSVIYVRARDPDRQWSDRALRHEALFLDEGKDSAVALMDVADLAVFSWYRHPFASRLLRRRARSGSAWCFWGERPGFRHKGLLGRMYRRWKLRELWRDDQVPIWGIGQWAIDGYRQEFGSSRPYRNVPYVSDLSSFLAIERAYRGNGAFNILYSGSLVERKGVRELCDAFARLSRRRKEACLTIVGDGPLREELSRKVGSNSRVNFLGFVDWDHLSAAYRNADLLCAPSHYDGWGLVVPEALAAGMPVIATTMVGSALEMLEEGRTGWLVPPRDIYSLESSLEAAIDAGRQRLSAMEGRCRETASRYSLGPGAARLLLAAREAVTNWHAAPRSV